MKIDHQTRNVSRIRIVVRGVVQGVGFRPFVHRLAHRLQLTGWVLNDPEGVTIEAEGPDDRLAELRARLETDHPVLARVTSVRVSPLPLVGSHTFEIRISEPNGTKSTMISPDMATCADCLREIFDRRNRRYQYPFTNCTHCGPRFSIIERLPYDRPHTSMKTFIMCDECQREYDDPDNRRFHAQPNACPTCGPQIELWDNRGQSIAKRHDALLLAVENIRQGRIVALKGIGGFQLIVDARNYEAVNELRLRKCREEKPLAIMVDTMDSARELCEVSDKECQLLTSPQAPIVLLRRRAKTDEIVDSAVAPGNPYLGVMLPYSPLHHLTMSELRCPIVATSGNRSDEPICFDENEAVQRLSDIADVFLVHNRRIVRHMDDSVVQVVRSREAVLRAARGYAPLTIPLREAGETILAVGAHQKNTVGVAMGRQFVSSQHIGDLVTPTALTAFERTVNDLPGLYDAAPAVVACDLHPNYASTLHAQRSMRSIIHAQHHHAHVVSCMAENGLTGTVLGVSWDGTGYGIDGTIWGGEFLRCTESNFEREGCLRPFPLPGGEKAGVEPRRSALGVLFAMHGPKLIETGCRHTIGAFSENELHLLIDAMRKSVQSPLTSSAGRLFDAVASMLGIRQITHHEGQAAMMLQFAAEESTTCEAYPFAVEAQATSDLCHGEKNNSESKISCLQIDWSPMILAMVRDVAAHGSLVDIARKFHNTLVNMIAKVARRCGEKRVVLTGGCFQNRLLTELTIERLERDGYHVYWHHHVPPNDGGIALGQAVVARARLRERSSCALQCPEES